jgi:UDP-N-acetylglucosamine 4,6-dehydratase
VMMSRGSVVPLFLEQISSEKPLTLTNPEMTRFLMSLDDSVALVKHAFLNGSTGDLFVQKAPAATVLTLATAVARIVGKEKLMDYEIIGTRHGEKLFESLLSSEDTARATNEGRYFRVPLDTRSLDYSKFFDDGNNAVKEFEPYTSQNTQQLNVEEVVNLLNSDKNFVKLLQEIEK